MQYSKKDNNSIRKIMLPKTVTLEDKDSFFSLISDFINSDIKTLELDFKNTKKIDSAGLGFLLIASQYCSDCKKLIILKNPSGSCRNVFNMMRFQNIFTIKHDIEEINFASPTISMIH